MNRSSWVCLMEPLFKIHMAIVQIMKTISHNASYGNSGSANTLAKNTYLYKRFLIRVGLHRDPLFWMKNILACSLNCFFILVPEK
jgi:hypothetical protein